MSDSIDSALNRHKNREAFVGAAVKYLGVERRRDAENLADLMVAQIDLISAAAGVVLKSGADIPEPLAKAIAEQAQRHAEAIAHEAVRAMANVLNTTLIMADRALRAVPMDEQLEREAGKPPRAN